MMPASRAEILAQAPLRDELVGRAVEGGDHANVHARRVGAAERSDPASFYGAQELRLNGRRQVAGLVQEKRPALRRTEVPDAVAVCPGERPAPVSEELRLGQSLRQGGAVQSQERPAPSAPSVDGVSDAFLADAGRANQDDRQIALGSPPYFGNGESKLSPSVEPRSDFFEKGFRELFENLGHHSHCTSEPHDVPGAKQGFPHAMSVDERPVRAAEITNSENASLPEDLRVPSRNALSLDPNGALGAPAHGKPSNDAIDPWAARIYPPNYRAGSGARARRTVLEPLRRIPRTRHSAPLTPKGAVGRC